jgi:hypothetical protein
MIGKTAKDFVKGVGNIGGGIFKNGPSNIMQIAGLNNGIMSLDTPEEPPLGAGEAMDPEYAFQLHLNNQGY